MSDTFAPRPYQLDAIKALHDGWQKGTNRLAVVLPTGAGKTVVFSHLAHKTLDSLGGLRVLVIAHREELLEQAASKLRAVDPTLRVAIVKGTLDESKRCDGRCLGARHASCDCSCAGKNHGAGHGIW